VATSISPRRRHVVISSGVRSSLSACAARPRQHHRRRAVALARRRHHQPGRRPDRVEDRGATRDDRLFAVGLPHRLRVQIRPALHQRPQDLGDALLERHVEHHLAPAEAPHDLGGEVVGGRSQPAAGDDQRHAGVAHELERRQEVLGAVAHDLDHGRVHADLAQALRQPGAVAVRDDPAEDLGAGDEDPRARRRRGPRGRCGA
jgi:hypothetical protein